MQDCIGRLVTGKQVHRGFWFFNMNEEIKASTRVSQVGLIYKSNCKLFKENGPLSVPVGHEE